MRLLLLALLLPIATQAATYAELWEAKVKAATLGGVIFVGGDTESMLGAGLNKRLLVVVPQKAYQAGDIVTFRNVNAIYVTHRVTAVRPGFVFTKGDFNRWGDGWIPLADVVGRVAR